MIVISADNDELESAKKKGADTWTHAACQYSHDTIAERFSYKNRL